MKELKTLKDLYFGDKDAGVAEIEVLKQEAIRWIKAGDRGRDLRDCREFIKHFFNITEEDLK